jgi:hypothetical protein
MITIALAPPVMRCRAENQVPTSLVVTQVGKNKKRNHPSQRAGLHFVAILNPRTGTKRPEIVVLNDLRACRSAIG